MKVGMSLLAVGNTELPAIEIVDAVDTAVGVDDAGRRVSTHSRRAHVVPGAADLLTRVFG